MLFRSGLIVVRSGGSLILKNVTLDLAGEGLFILQEPGGSVELTGVEPEDGLIAWSPPVVDNTHQQPPGLWLEEGTALTEAMLPNTLSTYLQYQGVQRWEKLALQWDMDGCGSQTEGEYTLSGTFLEPVFTTSNAVWAGLFPPYCVAFSCNTQSIPAKTRLVWRKNPSPTQHLRL